MNQRPIINNSRAVYLAQAVIRAWENSPDFALCQQLFTREPHYVEYARDVLEYSRGRMQICVKPRSHS